MKKQHYAQLFTKLIVCSLLVICVVFISGCKSDDITSNQANSSSEITNNHFSIDGIRYVVREGEVLIKGNAHNNTDEYMTHVTFSGYCYDKNGDKITNCVFNAAEMPDHQSSGYSGADSNQDFTVTHVSADDFAGIRFTQYQGFSEDGGGRADLRQRIDIDVPVSEMEEWHDEEHKW